MNAFHELTDAALRAQLLDAYAEQRRVYPDSASVVALKAELYRRGYRRLDITEIALAALLRHRFSAN